MSILIVDDSPHIHAQFGRAQLGGAQLGRLLSMAGFSDLVFATSAREAFS